MTTLAAPRTRTVTLAELGEFRNGVNFGKGAMGSGIGLINVKDIFRADPTIRFESLDLVNLAGIRGVERYFVEKGDLFFVRSSVKRDGIGLVAYADRSHRGAVHCGFVIRLRPRLDLVDPQFRKYTLRAPAMREQVRGLSGGSAITNISQDGLSRVTLDLPPLGEQRRIAGILSAYDDLIENCQRRIRILEEMARRLYREWFVHYRYPGHESIPLVPSPLGHIPEGWEVKTLASICNRMESGGTPLRSREEFWVEGTIDWYKTKELWDGHLFESEERITETGLAKSNARVFEPGTLLMAIYGSPTVGRLGIVTRPSSCNQAALGMVANPNFASQTFLYYLLMELREHFNSIAQGAAQQNISKEKVAAAKVALPTRDLVAQFDSIAAPVFDQLAVLAGTVRNLRRTRDLVLPRLLGGR